MEVDLHIVNWHSSCKHCQSWSYAPFQVNKIQNKTFTSCLHTLSRSHPDKQTLPSLSIMQQITVTMASKHSQLKQGTPSLLHHAHTVCTLDPLHKHSVQSAQGHNLCLIITVCEVSRLRNAWWYTVWAKCYSSRYKMGSACSMKSNSHWQLSLVLHIHKVYGSTPIMSTPANAKEKANSCHNSLYS